MKIIRQKFLIDAASHAVAAPPILGALDGYRRGGTAVVLRIACSANQAARIAIGIAPGVEPDVCRDV
jgi:hypothetical protein